MSFQASIPQIIGQAISSPQIISQAIASNSTIQNLPLGTVVQAADKVHDAGEFIYLKGLDGTVAGSVVAYNPDDNSTELISANATGPVVVAMSAAVTGEFGWYQIHGESVDEAVVADGEAVVADDEAVAATPEGE